MVCCPMCQAPVDVPGLDALISDRGITGHAAAILRAVWSGRGAGVKTERVFDAMYEDDPDGGPHLSKMYKSLWVGLSELECFLSGSGVEISYSGRIEGGLFRLKLQGATHE